MDIYNNPSRQQWQHLQRRCQSSQNDIQQVVERIVQQVKTQGDAGIRAVCQGIGEELPEQLRISDREIAAAADKVSAELKTALQRAKTNIEAFHRAQLPHPVEVETSPGVHCSQRAVPLHRVGLYIPGGKAPLFSTVLMLAVPAAIAGCSEVIMCTPARKDGTICPDILYAANLCGICRIYAIGGAQAIAAMAYGTESVPKVDKIFGPGNRYVTAAKQLVGSDSVAIDMPAGPSEVMVIADDSAVPAFVAADLLSQCEHGEDSQAILLCANTELANKVAEETERQLQQLPRKDIAEKSLKNSRIIVLKSTDEMIDFANGYGSEHLIIAMRDPEIVAEKIYAAGSIFLGNYSPESAGDYASGTNHTLPTNGWAHSYSGVNIDSYMRKITYQRLTREGLQGLASTITAMAQAEGLDAHARAVEIRMKGGQEE